MDIELKLRERLVLRDPGARFTEQVLSKLGDVPDGAPREGVVQLSEARRQQRGRRLLVGAMLVAAAAAATLPFMHARDGDEAVAEIVMPAPSVEEPLTGELPVTGAVQNLPAPTPGLADCVDPHVLFGLLLPSVTAFKVTSAPPSDLDTLQPPRELAWLGGTERITTGASTLAAVYRTDLSPDAARAAMAGALAAAGWKPLFGNYAPTSRNVFASATVSVASWTYCRDGRPVMLTSSALDGVTYVVLSIQRGAGFAGTCEQPTLQSANVESPVDDILPRLELPRDPATGRTVAMRSGGAGGGGARQQSNVSFRSTDSLGGIASHFASQLAAQGWQSDTGWSGASSAGSTWLRSADDDTLLEGALKISAFGNDRYTVVFRVAQVN